MYRLRSMSALLVAAVACVLMMAGTSMAEEHVVINTAKLKGMLDAKEQFTLIDARTKGEYEEAHIAGAINVMEKDFDGNDPLGLQSKDSLLVFYCNGVKCGKSKKAAAKAMSAGYTNIMIYAEGFPVWEEMGYAIVAGPEYGKKVQTRMLSPKELSDIMAAGADGYVLVDVRDETEFGEGHIPGAINIPSEVFAAKSGVLPKEKKIIVYCNGGGRSYNAYRKLQKLGYSDIYQTLLADWKDAGRQVMK